MEENLRELINKLKLEDGIQKLMKFIQDEEVRIFWLILRHII